MTNKKHTYCPRLWDEVFIEENGKVYTCCHRKPDVLGNIYSENLADIINNSKMQELRKKSMQGKLGCYRFCTLLDKGSDAPKPSDHVIKPGMPGYRIEYSGLKRLKVQFGELCNIACIMCWQDHDSKEVLDFDKFIENVDISPFEKIEIQGGEPLFIKDAKRFFEYIAEHGKKVSFLTNGMPINDKWAEKIALHSEFIHFSLNAGTKETHEKVNAGSKWETVLKNIGKVRKFKDIHNTDVHIMGHMTLIPENIHEIPVFIEKYVEFGFESVEFGHDYKLPFQMKLHPIKIAKLKKEIAEVLGKMKPNGPNRSNELNGKNGAINLHDLELLGLV